MLFESGLGSCCDQHKPQRTLWLCYGFRQINDSLLPLTIDQDNCLHTSVTKCTVQPDFKCNVKYKSVESKEIVTICKEQTKAEGTICLI